MANTYTLIESQVLGSSAASVTFSAIPSTYTDLVLRYSARNDGSTTILGITFNGDTATNYSSMILRGSGASASSFSYATRSQLFQQDGIEPDTMTSNTFVNAEIYIPSYLVSQNKPISGFTATEDNSSTAYMSAIAHLWQNTAAITSINLYSNSGNIVTDSSFYLYGISNTI
jgi:hypothetical protein